MKNSDITKENFEGFDRLYIPAIHHKLSSKRTIVMEYIDGIKIDETEALKEKYGDAKKCSDILLDVFAKMIFVDGHIHCDAHPGNILVRNNPKSSEP